MEDFATALQLFGRQIYEGPTRVEEVQPSQTKTPMTFQLPKKIGIRFGTRHASHNNRLLSDWSIVFNVLCQVVLVR